MDWLGTEWSGFNSWQKQWPLSLLPYPDGLSPNTLSNEYFPLYAFMTYNYAGDQLLCFAVVVCVIFRFCHPIDLSTVLMYLILTVNLTENIMLGHHWNNYKCHGFSIHYVISSYCLPAKNQQGINWLLKWLSFYRLVDSNPEWDFRFLSTAMDSSNFLNHIKLDLS
jgi:hypothetical protein